MPRRIFEVPLKSARSFLISSMNIYKEGMFIGTFYGIEFEYEALDEDTYHLLASMYDVYVFDTIYSLKNNEPYTIKIKQDVYGEYVDLADILKSDADGRVLLPTKVAASNNIIVTTTTRTINLAEYLKLDIDCIYEVKYNRDKDTIDFYFRGADRPFFSTVERVNNTIEYDDIEKEEEDEDNAGV